jgi:hypothetical protein
MTTCSRESFKIAPFNPRTFWNLHLSQSAVKLKHQLQ